MFNESALIAEHRQYPVAQNCHFETAAQKHSPQAPNPKTPEPLSPTLEALAPGAP